MLTNNMYTYDDHCGIAHTFIIHYFHYFHYFHHILLGLEKIISNNY